MRFGSIHRHYCYRCEKYHHHTAECAVESRHASLVRRAQQAFYILYEKRIPDVDQQLVDNIEVLTIKKYLASTEAA